MKYILLCLVWVSVFLNAEDYPHRFEGKFEGWSEKKLDLISMFLPLDPVIVQAGAHYGKETVSLAAQWPEAKIICFEPNPHAFNLLRLKTAGCKNTHLYNLALSHQAMISPFYVCYGTTGQDPIYEHASSLLKPSPQMEVHYQGPKLDVECANLDEWCQQNGIDHVDFLRLDVQGSEMQVLKSSPQILNKIKVIYVATSMFPFREGTTLYEDLKSFLESSGFTFLSHWYREGLEGQAIFVQSSFLDAVSMDMSDYQPYFIYDLNAHFYVDDLPDGIKSFLRRGIFWEGNIGLIIKKYVKEGTIAVDVGSHIGIHTLTMSRKVGPQGAVFAFEPQKKMYAEQVENLSVNQCNNVLSIRKALGDCNKTIQMALRDPGNEGGTMIGEGGDVAEMITLDSLNLKNVSLIKVDVEHFEYFVFLGAKETIERNKPVIVFEIMGNYDYKTGTDEIKQQFDRVIDLVESFGYKVYQVFGNDHIAFPLERLSF